MSRRPRRSDQEGKVPREFLEAAVLPNLGAKRRSVLVGPGQGLDNAVVSVGPGKVLVVTGDPVSVIPQVGLRESAWLSVHLLASDLTSSGVRPQFAMVDLNLPLEMSLPETATYLEAVGDECKRLGVAIVGGHTGRYPGSGYTVVGGGVMFSLAGREEYVTPAMARPRDSIIMTKGAAVGAAAVLARSFPETVREKAGSRTLRKARSRLHDCSTVKDALAASSVGLREAVAAMHDATEGGVLGGLSELSAACGLPVVVERERIHVPEEAEAVCAAFGLDPLTTLSEGTLFVVCRPGAADEVRSALRAEGVASYEVGSVGPAGLGTGLLLSSKGSKPRPHRPGPDMYWKAYSEALAGGG